METKLIQTHNYLLFIDENADKKVGDKVKFDCGYAFEPCVTYDHSMDEENCRLLLGYFPIRESSKKLDVPSLPDPFEGIDIERLVSEKYPASPQKRRLFMEGYNAAGSTSAQFTLNDIKDAFNAGCDYGSTPADSMAKEMLSMEMFLTWLMIKKLPNIFIPEYEYQTREGEWKSVLLPSERFNTEEGSNPKRIKMEINAEGKEVLVGTYRRQENGVEII